MPRPSRKQAILEALASDIPVIASNIRGYRETLKGSGAALFFAPGSSADLSRVLSDLGSRASLRKSMGRAGRAFVERYAWSRIGARVEDVYRELLSPARAGNPRLV